MLAGVVVFLVFNIFAGAGPEGIYEYIDMPTLLSMVIFTVLAVALTGRGRDVFHGVRIAFSGQIDKVSRVELQKSVMALKFVRNVVFLEAAANVSILFVDLLYRMSDVATLGPAMAVMGLSLFYAVVFALVVVLVTEVLEGLLVSYMEQEEEGALLDSQTIYFKLRALGLTNREAEVARLVSCGMSNKEIGEMLYISDSTVKKHITHILEKTKLEDREKLTEMIQQM